MKSESVKHTSGPWETLAPASGYRGLWKVLAGDESILELSPAFSTEANARLIAAAPELLEACKLLYDGATESRGFWQSTTAIKARAAIAKAEGSL